MSKKSQSEIAGLMKPYRARIDAIDRDIIDLLRKRYNVIEEVAEFKGSENIPPVLQDRVDEVRENAARMAAECNLDEAFIRDLYAQLIKHCCDLEDHLMFGDDASAAQKKAS